MILEMYSGSGSTGGGISMNDLLVSFSLLRN